jgi:hypothetical protein
MPATLRVLVHAYVVVFVLLWPVTTLISTAFALKLKIPRLPARQRGLGLKSQMIDSVN